MVYFPVLCHVYVCLEFWHNERSFATGGLPVNLQTFDSDEEGNDNSLVTMSVVSQEPASPKFSLQPVPNTKMQQLTFAGCFDYDKIKEYKVIIQGKDNGTPSLSTTSTITLDITDANTHLPVFTKTTYSTSVLEMETKEILRIQVTDKDEPNTPASRPVFTILKGNEDGNYMILTDPKTNEGVLSVVKGKDYERTALVQLEVAVENEVPLFVCRDGVVVDPKTLPPPQTVSVDVQVVDVNDPPQFDKTLERAFEKEEVPPGLTLYKPKVTDEDSDDDKIRFELVEDHADWLSIDEKTGVVTSVKTMDRESKYVHNSIYTVKVLAIDDGKPPETGTSTLQIVLGDINDNKPHLVTKDTVLCSHKDRVPVNAWDWDIPPYSGPFSFAFRGDNVEDLKTKWKLFPTTGENITLVSLTTLAYGNYTIPLLMEDQQGVEGEDEITVVVCDCAGGTECRGPLPTTSQLGGPGIGTLIAGLLLLLLLLLLFLFCHCEGKKFEPLNMQDEGHQTLIKYNEEGGGTASKAEPTLIRSPTTYVKTVTVTDGLKQAAIPLPQVSTNTYQVETQETSGMMRGHQASGMQYSSNGMGQMGQVSQANNSFRRSTMQQTWNSSTMNRTGTMRTGFSRSISCTDRYIADHIDRRLYEIGEEQVDYPGCSLHEYAYEGNGSRCQSLDALSFDDLEDSTDFLRNLGPSFKALGGICQKHMQEKNMKH
ncbi:cadherin-like protein 26 isoform X2 [Sardina pilchardus]|uniref:cadherin-like protein 26 isoform X2 n=1 Tax=Sardina pilchardus TaxID=27697 RepID=UPI002E160399